MERLDLATWPRREAYEVFSQIAQPWYSLSFTLDVTAVFDYVKPRKLSFYYALVFLCTRAMNAVEAFRMTIRAGEVMVLPARVPSFTDLHPGAEQFHIVTLPDGNDLDRFCTEARRVSQRQTRFVDTETESDALIYFSCLPWLPLTAATNERDADPDDAIPRVTWGRYEENAGRKRLTLCLEVNHRLIDGVHVGRFYETLCRDIRELQA